MKKLFRFGGKNVDARPNDPTAHLATTDGSEETHDELSLDFDHADNEKGWDYYASQWKAEMSGDFAHLGDEWTAEVHDSDYLELLEKNILDKYLGRPDTLLEIGPGGGRITASLLGYCRKRLIACDVSAKMLGLIDERFKHDGRVETLKLTIGRGLAEAPKNVADAIVSFEVFVHIEPHDIWEYVDTFWDVMKPGAIGMIHHANTATRQGFEQFIADHPNCINQRKPWASFSVMTPEIFRRMLDYRGFEVVDEVHKLAQEEERDCLSIFRRPS